MPAARRGEAAPAAAAAADRDAAWSRRAPTPPAEDRPKAESGGGAWRPKKAAEAPSSGPAGAFTQHSMRLRAALRMTRRQVL